MLTFQHYRPQAHGIGGLGAVLALCLSVPAAQASGLVINIVPGTTLQANPLALQSFQRAAQAWEALFTNDVTVNINADLISLSGSILGQASSVDLVTSYTAIRQALVLGSAGESTQALENALPTSMPAFTLASGFTTDGNIIGTKAEMKALGFTNLDSQFGSTDATIDFNSNFAFTYDNSGGVTAGTIDFQSVAEHEIGHALGFFSSVDTIDSTSLSSGVIQPTVLDLFRFASTSAPTTLAGFTTAQRSLLYGDTPVFDDTYASYLMSTGVVHGDGHQASHWKDDAITGSNIGIMDPTLSYGTIASITTADIRALQDIGWDSAVPEPGTVLLAVSALAFLGWHRRRTAGCPRG